MSCASASGVAGTRMCVSKVSTRMSGTMERMKISMEYKDKKYTLTFGKMTATASTIEEAIDGIVNSFRETLNRFFVIKRP